MTTVAEGTVLWEPPAALRDHSRMTEYMQWLARFRGAQFSDYEALRQWSVGHIAGFWSSIWDFFGIQSPSPHAEVLVGHEMPGARWFPGATLNYAEQVFRQSTPLHPALIFQAEGLPVEALSWAELESSVAAVAAALRAMGIRSGDRVAAYLPNCPQAVIAFLACASLGAIWSSCSPDMGGASVVDRFRQIEPRILFAVDGYRYGGKRFDRMAMVAELRASLPCIEQVVLIPYLETNVGLGAVEGDVLWSDLVRGASPPAYMAVPFEHPLWVLYSSGTTGLPKPIVQGHGGIVLEHLKVLALHHNLSAGDRFFWFTTTGWMMWNFLVSGLLVGATIVLYDGSPGWPDLNVLWDFAARTEVSLFGAGAAFLGSCMKAGITPGASHDLSHLTAIGSTGSPLSVDGFQWVYDQVKLDLWLGSVSGGTDVCTAFVGACPLLPVRAGEIQCRCLGTAVEAFDETGSPVLDQVGELVVTQPMPSMPLYFWNDPDGSRYRESYFELFPGVWRHGDWVKVTGHGGVVIYGRSDATINRQGIRMGTSEFYRVVEELPEVVDSLVIDLEGLGRESYMALFIVLRPGLELDATLTAKIREAIRGALSARYLPNQIFAITEAPRTLSGKKMELPVKRVLLGVAVEKAANPDSMSNPGSMQFFVDLAARLPPV
ncbi:MAG TPA: acetoacetate--CoA ligase [Chloroflexota bacterium]|nr:acetoacetate--CoA ligase [Chloroflexota bacterium]